MFIRNTDHSCQGIVLQLGKYCPHYPVPFFTSYVLRLKDEKKTFKLSYILVSTQHEIQVGTCVQQKFKSVCASALIDQSHSVPTEETLNIWLPTVCLLKNLVRL